MNVVVPDLPNEPPHGPPRAVNRPEDRMVRRGHAAGHAAGRAGEGLPVCPYGGGRPAWLWLKSASYGWLEGYKELESVRRSYAEGLEQLERGRPNPWAHAS